MKLSVVVPVFNEATTIKTVIKRLLAIQEVSEIVVVDDASTDESLSICKAIRSKRIKTVNHTTNMGKGAAIRSGLEHVSGDYVLIQDADLEYDPDDIPNLLRPIQKEKAQIVYGSRFTGPRKNMFFWHMVGNRMLTLIVNVLFNTTLSDMETCYKILPTDMMKELDLISNDFAIEPEITCKLLKRGNFIYEVPISYTGRTFEEGKKITWVDGFRAFRMILYVRFID